MPTLIRREQGRLIEVDDLFISLADDEAAPPKGDVILSLKRFLAEGETLAGAGRAVGVRLEPNEAVEDLTYDLPTVPVVALVFPKFRDGRPYSAARLLRERFGYAGEIRAVGEVLRDQALFMLRCGFDGFAPADGSSAEDWRAAGERFRHVYQRAADGRAAAFDLRAAPAAELIHGL